MTWFRSIVTVCACALVLAFPATLMAQVTDQWFKLETDDDLGPSVIDTSDWLDKPAGKHGGVRIDATSGQFVFEDGTPVKFWGTNIANGWPYNAGRDEAVRWARYLAKYGINGLRWHKFTSHGLEGMPGSTVINPDKQKAMDWFNHQLRENGIYYSWSHIYGHRPREADRARLLAYDEIKAIDVPWKHLNQSTSFLVYFAEDLQDLHIELTVNMLEHVNPHTGLAYAADPALVFIELQNEETIFWSAHERHLQATPTYRALLCRKFSEWLGAKYGSQEKLAAAWGGEGLEDGQSLDRANVYPRPNHDWFAKQFDEAAKANKPIPRHVLDRATFLYEQQQTFYDRYAKAIRDAGYKGPIVGSCWQAGKGITHFYNLYSDANINGEPQIVDRHNYFGGRPTETMLDAPGSGLLGTGMQQVKNRPFQVSEWLYTGQDKGYAAEAPVVVAAYGMGLQGWAGSYSYCQNTPFLTDGLRSPRHGEWNIDTPTHVGLYPALARMVYRGDVKTGDVVSVRHVHVPSLADGKLGIVEDVKQDARNYDRKEFTGVAPAEALAAGRVLIEFVDRPTPTATPDMSKWWDRDRRVVRSTTGQLAWDYSGEGSQKGFFTIDTPGTQAVVGFASGRPHALAHATITLDTPYAVVLVTSLDKDAPVVTATRLLVTTIARAATVENHTAVEPVVATLKLNRPGTPKVRVLDHVGRRTDRTVAAAADGAVRLDGAATRAMYYEVTYGG